MNRDPFLEQLTSGLQKIPTRMRPLKAFLLMLGVSSVAGLVLSAWNGLRPDIAEVMHRASYRWEILLLVLFSCAAYSLAERSATPGALQHPRRMGMSLAAVFLIILGLLLQHPNFGMPAHFFEGVHCLILITLTGIVPMVFTLYMLRKGAPTRPRLSMAWALFGSFGAAVAVQHTICPSEDPWHLIGWHLSILPLAALSAWAFGRRLLHW